ncbi:MAG TPA: ABC transporter permease [Thermotogota bacterium]|nr:ABC transporter permease [Thermotogota bacterium]HRW34292.1 ABC transporter permease [Thermotogota bacterium]
MFSLKNIFSDSAFYASIIRVSTPILFAAMGALVAGVAGTPNVALEGIMLMSAFSGAVVSAITHSLAWGVIGGLSSALILSVILCVFSLKYRANIILTAIAINILSSGLTGFLLPVVSRQTGSTTCLESIPFPQIHIAFLDHIPFLGKILNNHHLLTYLAYICVLLIYILLKKTPFGNHLKAVGENPEAAVSVGLSVNKIRTTALIISGLLTGFGGMFLSMGSISWFTKEMTGGRGWIALAAQALGGKGVWTVTASTLLFSTGESFSYSLQIYNIPTELVQALPFAITLVVLFIYLNSR